MEFKNLEDVLPSGRRIIKVYKAHEWDAEIGDFDRHTHKRTVPNQAGIRGYIYNTNVEYVDDNGKKRRCNVFAYDKERKELFDSGEVEVNVVEYYILENGKLATKKEVEEKQLSILMKQTADGTIVPAIKKKAFFNKVENSVNRFSETPTTKTTKANDDVLWKEWEESDKDDTEPDRDNAQF